MEFRLRKLGLLLFAGLMIGLVTSACGSGNDVTSANNSTETTPATITPTSTPPRLAFLTPGAPSQTKVPTVAPTSLPTTGTGPSSGATDPMGNPIEDDILVLGEKIFTVGSDKRDQIGCQYCHAPDGRGNIGPNIRGKMVGDVAFALDNVEAMFFLRLNDSEIEAIAEYLQWLSTQP